MNLLFDLIATQPSVDGKYHGGGKYAKIVFLKLVEKLTNNKKINLYVLIDNTKFIEQEIIDIISKKHINLIDINHLSIDNIIKSYNIERFYTALPDNFRNIEKFQCEIIIAIHGLRRFETKLSRHALVYERGIKYLKIVLKIIASKYINKRDIKHCKQLLTLNNIQFYAVSYHTKYAIKSFFPEVNIDEIKVFYSPDVTIEFPKNNYKIKNYFLMVSGNRWLKNNLRSAIAIDQIISNFPNFKIKVIITGITNNNIYLKHLKNQQCFTLLNYVSEKELFYLYQNAYAFIYPSLNEGFGYPPLEAMRFGVPVIASAFSSIPEICSDAVLYTNPYSIDEIMNRILQLLCDKALYQKLKINGRKRFSIIKQKQKTDLNALVEYIIDE